jgi:tetratricopeptide (TPR) repeat protein
MMSFRRVIATSRRRRRRLAVVAVSVLSLTGAGAALWGDSVRAAYHLRAARRELDGRDYDAADARLTRHLELAPDSAEGHFLMARLSRRMGRSGDARDHLTACRRLRYPEAPLALEACLLRVQDGDFGGGADGVLRRGLDDYPAERFLIFEALSQGYTKTYRLQEARYCLNQMLESEPDNAYALARRGWVLERLGDFDAARADYRRAVALQPENVPVRRRLAENLFYTQRNAADAIEHFEALWRALPDDVTVGVNLALCRRQQGRADDARALFDELLAAHPDDVAVLSERGKLALDEGQPEKAEVWLRRAVDRDPSSLPASYALFRCLGQLGRTREADRWHERVRALEADRKRLDELIARVGRAPGDAGLRCEIARLFLQFGETREGERWLAAALQIDPRYPPAHAGLADCCEKRGDTDAAERHRLAARAGPPPGPAGGRSRHD